MSTSVIASELDAIRAGLVALAELSEVNVFSGAVPVEDAGPECIAFGDATLTDIAAAMGGVREETWTVTGQVWVVKPWEGDLEATISAARLRVAELWAAVETYLNDTYTGTLPAAAMTEGDLENSFGPDGRICSLRFSFEILNLKTP